VQRFRLLAPPGEQPGHHYSVDLDLDLEPVLRCGGQ
jgi:hypothetical protein